MIIDNKKQISGITLVALVITIIVLLIIAGITIAQLSNNGLFERTRVAKEKYDFSKNNEDKGIEEYSNEVESYINANRDYAEEIKKLESRIAQLECSNTYSATEKVVGTWINNKPIYSKDIYIEHLPSSATAVNYNHGISDVDEIWVDLANSFMDWGQGNTTPLPVVSSNNGSNIMGVANINRTVIEIKADSNRSSKSAHIVVRYTKTTD